MNILDNNVYIQWCMFNDEGMNDKNHNDLSIPYKVPHFVCLEEGTEQGEGRGVVLSKENANGSYHIWASGGNTC